MCHRNPLWKDYCETAQIGKAENAQTLMCHRNPLGRIYCGTEQVGEVENAQTLDVSLQSFRKDLLLNSTDWKSREHRHSCVIAILCESIYGETAKTGKGWECTDTHVSSQSFGKDLPWNRAGWRSRERTDTRCVIAILQKGFTVEQHRLEKQRTHRHLCVIAILCESIYGETTQTGKGWERTDTHVSSQSFGKDLLWNRAGGEVENAQALMCCRNHLERI